MKKQPTASHLPSLKPVLLGGLIAGTCDLLFAIFYYGNGGAKTLRVLQSVAGGLFGKTTYQGGVETAVLGLGLHYLISSIWATVFVLVAGKGPFLRRRAVVCGLVFGAVIYFFMNMIVLPLSAYHAKAWPPPFALWPFAIHVFGVGLPIALVTRWYARSSSQKSLP